MTSKMALGSVSTLALGALLVGAMPYIISRTVGASTAAPWGAIAGLKSEGLANTPESSDTAESRRVQLLKLASLKTDSAPAAPASPAAPVETVSASTDAPPPPPSTDGAKPAPKDLPMDGTTLSGTPVPMQAVSSSDVEINTASIDPSRGVPTPPPSVRAATPQSSGVNINTASTDLLDRFPGVGRIGHAIVTHRPYRDVSDLVRKRVLRMSDFQKIQSRIRVD